MHHGQIRGNEKHVNVRKKTRTFYEIRGEILKSREEIINFPK